MDLPRAEVTGSFSQSVGENGPSRARKKAGVIRGKPPADEPAGIVKQDYSDNL